MAVFSNINIKQVVFDYILPIFCDSIQHNGDANLRHQEVKQRMVTAIIVPFSA